jgi:hypothetical protein
LELLGLRLSKASFTLFDLLASISNSLSKSPAESKFLTASISFSTIFFPQLFQFAVF